MKVIKRKSIKGRKLVIKKIENNKDMEKYNVTSNYVLTLDGILEWEADSESEIIEFLESWGDNNEDTRF